MYTTKPEQFPFYFLIVPHSPSTVIAFSALHCLFAQKNILEKKKKSFSSEKKLLDKILGNNIFAIYILGDCILRLL